MIYGVYSIYDKKALIYNPPYFAHNDGTAVRIVADSMAQGTSLARHPADYAVFKVGEFNDQTGGIVATTPPQFTVELVSLLDKKQQADLFGLTC